MPEETSVIEQDQSSVRGMAEHYGVSIIVNRWLGCWVDIVVSVSCLLIPDWLLGNELYRKTLFIWLVLALSYFVVTEWLWGRTLGKLLTGTIVVNENGHRPSFGQVIVRTLFRLVEVNPLIVGGVPAGIVAYFSKRKQRIGDMAANTYVIRTRDLAKTSAPQSTISLTPTEEYPATPQRAEPFAKKPSLWNYVGIGVGTFMLLFLFIPQVMSGTLATQYYLGAAFWGGVIIYCSIKISRVKKL